MGATLALLRIRNLALVEELLWEPPRGFIALTGETGAGKSVVIGALNLLLGARAEKSLIRASADHCVVEAVFSEVNDPRIPRLLEENGMEPCEDAQLLIKRQISVSSAGRQFVNNSACTLGLLKALGDLLVDLHGPHDHQSLLSRENQTHVLDAYAGSADARETFRSARRVRMSLEREAEELVRHEQEALREIDLLEHQVNEIEEAGLSAGEEEVLVSKLHAARNAARIGQLMAQAEEVLEEGENSMRSQLAQAVRLGREFASLDPGAEPFAVAVESLAAALDEASESLRSYSGDFDESPTALAAIEDRLDVIGSLKRKYGSTVEQVIAFGRAASAKLSVLREREHRGTLLQGEIDSARKEEVRLATGLTRLRLKGAASLSKAISHALKDLGFLKSGFEIALSRLDEPGPLGAELADFQFAPNPGEPARPLREIASSGEMSRVMLAIKGVLSAVDEVALLVFDEIDANVGGEIAFGVARRMRELASTRQVLCITHLPQVASQADAHFVVRKETRDGRTVTFLDHCEGADRTGEIARMLGGKNEASLRHARELLGVNAGGAR